jgi:glutamate-1-semialdehyde 2,1-aminomutase
VLGKVLGGGLPAAAFGGPVESMERVAPAGDVYQAGTLSGNPLAMAAGLATLDGLADGSAWERAERWARDAAELLERAAVRAEIPLRVQRVGTIFTPFFASEPVADYAAARRADRERYAHFFHHMLTAGVYLPPSPFEAAFTSAAHGPAELEAFAVAMATSFARLRE